MANEQFKNARVREDAGQTVVTILDDRGNAVEERRYATAEFQKIGRADVGPVPSGPVRFDDRAGATGQPAPAPVVAAGEQGAGMAPRGAVSETDNVMAGDFAPQAVGEEWPPPNLSDAEPLDIREGSTAGARGKPKA